MLALASVIAIMGAGCSTQTIKPIIPVPVAPAPVAVGEVLAPDAKQSMAQFMKDSWKIMKIQKIGGESQDLSALNLTLDFDGKTMTGKVCNNLNGTYTVADNMVTFGPVVSTKMFCEGLPGEVESALSAGFEKGYRVTKQGEGMIVQGAATFELQRADNGGDY